MEYCMNLHHYQEDFKELVVLTSKKTGLTDSFVEKDYWITYVLRNLANSPYANNFIFKGGTALSKAYKIIERFSEDIDLAVRLEDVTGNQQKKLIDTTSKVITKDLVEIYKEGVTSKGSRFRRTAHEYPKSFPKKIFYQTKDEIIIEINSFIQPKDFTTIPISSYVADFLRDTGQEQEIVRFGLQSFEVQVLGLQRTFTEKILSLVRASYMEDNVLELQERVRHCYDLFMLLKTNEIQDFFNSEQFLQYLQQTKKDDASNKEFYGSWVEKPLANAPLITQYNTLWKELEITYKGTFSTLVYGKLPDSSAIDTTMQRIFSKIQDAEI